MDYYGDREEGLIEVTDPDGDVYSQVCVRFKDEALCDYDGAAYIEDQEIASLISWGFIVDKDYY